MNSKCFGIVLYLFCIDLSLKFKFIEIQKSLNYIFALTSSITNQHALPCASQSYPSRPQSRTTPQPAVSLLFAACASSATIRSGGDPPCQALPQWRLALSESASASPLTIQREVILRLPFLRRHSVSLCGASLEVGIVYRSNRVQGVWASLVHVRESISSAHSVKQTRTVHNTCSLCVPRVFVSPKD